MSDTRDNPVDRRKEPRLPAHGAITLQASEPFERTIAGQLLDVSLSGFRFSHHDEDLLAGQRVRFSMWRTPEERQSGIAQVVWRRILGGHIECGCRIEPA